MNDDNTCPKCGEPLEEHQTLTYGEYQAVTRAFVKRLREAMGRAGCNDVFPDEFSESVSGRFRSDLELLEAWEEFHSRCICEDLKNEAGKAAFALTIGWPLPEELIAARRHLAREQERSKALAKALDIAGLHLLLAAGILPRGQDRDGVVAWADEAARVVEAKWTVSVRSRSCAGRCRRARR